MSKIKHFHFSILAIFYAAIMITAIPFVFVLACLISSRHLFFLYILSIYAVCSGCALFLIYYYAFRSVLRINQAVASFLLSDQFNSINQRDEKTDQDLLTVFQMIIDREYSSEILRKQAELDALQSQINPHFLYNALETIRGQATLMNAPEVADMSCALSNFFRYSISRKSKMVFLEEELSSVKFYTKIQNYRFGNRYRLYFDIEDFDKTTRLYMPRLTLQPIVENSLLHGLRNSLNEQDCIQIIAFSTEYHLVIQIIDHGVGIEEDTLKQMNTRLCEPCKFSTSENTSSRHNGIALENINDRIKILCGNDYGLVITSALGFGTTVTITLPLITEYNE